MDDMRPFDIALVAGAMLICCKALASVVAFIYLRYSATPSASTQEKKKREKGPKKDKTQEYSTSPANPPVPANGNSAHASVYKPAPQPTQVQQAEKSNDREDYAPRKRTTFTRAYLGGSADSEGFSTREIEQAIRASIAPEKECHKENGWTKVTGQKNRRSANGRGGS